MLMTILSAQSIRSLCHLGDLPLAKFGLISPFSERAVFEGKSYGLGPCGYDIRLAQDVELWPGDFLLASSLEHFNLPNNVVARAHNKSSWARLGIDASFSTVLEPGWKGHLTIEIKDNRPISRMVEHTYHYNDEGHYSDKGEVELEHHLTHPARLTQLKLKAGTPILQIIFEWVDKATDTPYTGKYQNQPNRPVPSLNEGESCVLN
jgi:dCTP deaminase